MKVKWKWSLSVMSDSWPPHELWFLCPWDSPGKSTGVRCHFLLQGIFLTQGLNPGLPHRRPMLYHLSHHKSCVKNRPSGFKSREVPPRWMIILAAGASAAKSLQSRPTLCDPIDTRLPHPGDSPGKNTGVGCHFLLQCVRVKSESEVAQSCPTPSDPLDCSPPGSSSPGILQARVLEWGIILASFY